MIKETMHTIAVSKHDAKRTFQRNLNIALKEKEDWAKDTAQIMCKYLSEVHNVELPHDFAEQISEAHNQFHANQKKICFPLKLVDAIISACDMWREYLESSEGIFDQLVCQEILSMVRIQTSVIAGRNFDERHCLPLRKKPPFLFTTIVTEFGTISVYS